MNPGPVKSGLTALDAWLGYSTPADPGQPPPSPLGSLAWSPAIRSRNSVAYMTVRSWRAATRKADLAAFKNMKRDKDPALIDAAAGEIAARIEATIGHLAGWVCTNIACGHSRDCLCWGRLLAEAAAKRLALDFIEVFKARPISSSSHPKEFRRLPPLEWAAKPDRPVILIDDVATSGWHLEEAATRIRHLGLPCLPIAWIGGETKG